jgi:hypothetical protein
MHVLLKANETYALGRQPLKKEKKEEESQAE